MSRPMQLVLYGVIVALLGEIVLLVLERRGEQAREAIELECYDACFPFASELVEDQEGKTRSRYCECASPDGTFHEYESLE